MTTFENFNRKLIIREGQLGHTDEKIVGIKVRDSNEAEAFVVPADAPAVALAVLEAAGLEDGAVIRHVVADLREYIAIDAQRRAEQSKNAAILRFYQSDQNATGSHDGPWDGLTDAAQEQYRARYHAAREFFGEGA